MSYPGSLKKNLELNPRQESHSFGLVLLTLVLISTKADLIAKEQSCKQGTVGDKGAGGINMILTILEGLFGGLRVRDDWLEPGGLNPYRTCHRPKVFLGVLGGSWAGDQTRAWQGVSARTRAWCHRCRAEFGNLN